MASDAGSPRFSLPAHRSAPEHAVSRLDLVTGALPRDERARQRRVEEIDRHSIIEHPAHPGRRHGTAVSAAVLVQPSGYLGVMLAKTAGRNADPDADGGTSLGHSDHVARVTWHSVSLVMRSHPSFTASTSLTSRQHKARETLKPSRRTSTQWTGAR
jgi:hypothetical protein